VLKACGLSPAIWHRKLSDHELAGNLSELIENGAAGLRLTRLAKVIYESRPELQRIFPDPCGRDSVKFLVWLLTYGRKEHQLSEDCLLPLRQQWDAVLALLPSRRARLWYRFLLAGMKLSVTLQPSIQRSLIGARMIRAKFRLGRLAQRPPGTHGEQRSPAPGSIEQIDV
jgi:hypothetical protein